MQKNSVVYVGVVAVSVAVVTLTWYLKNRRDKQFTTKDLIALCKKTEPHLTGSDQKTHFQVLEGNYQLFNQVLLDDPENAIILLGYIWRFYCVTGRQKIGYEAAKSLNKKDLPITAVSAKYLLAFGMLAHATGSFNEAKDILRRSLQMYLQLPGDSKLDRAIIINQIGVCSREKGDYVEAESLHKQALGLFTEINNEWGIGLALSNLGVVAREQGGWDAAKNYFQKSLEIRMKIQDSIGIASSLGNMGAISYALSEYEDAIGLHERCLTIRLSLGDSWGVCGAKLNLGMNYCETENYLKARHHLLGAIHSFYKMNDRLGVCECIEATGCLVAKLLEFETASILFGCAKKLRETLDCSVPLTRSGHHQRYTNSIVAKIGAAAYARYEQQGKSKDYKESYTFAENHLAVPKK